MANTTGTVGQVYYRQVRGKLVVSARPKPGRKFTAAQLAWQKRFGELSKGTKALLADPEVKEKYQAQINNQKFTAHMVAQSEMMKTPEVRDIDLSLYNYKTGGDIIVTTDTDPTVTKVLVVIADESGAVIESGEAIKHKLFPGIWTYAARQLTSSGGRLIVTASARNLHGNFGQKMVALSVSV